ncbi:MAG: SOS response-associated peptidase [Burkholderiaceae bacterium]|nr:SOS response-associated peptidase [Sulfuritalea sp.]MCF8173733.1 SOS response-associated peptidase [Burkholderiaceae bacterium]MCF8183832.1 SOS response-associated peptidase [Polynucleobacter sp.]
MCGRYALYGPLSRLTEYFDLQTCADWEARYNIAPQSAILVVRDRTGIGRVGQMVKWGLIPRWAKNAAISQKLNNARAETVAEKPSFKASFERHRCLIPANGFYEWQAVSAEGKARKQPWFVRPANDEDFFAFAGLLAVWTSPEGQDVVTACVITTTPNAVMAPIHERMPVLLPRQHFDAWLDPAMRDSEALRAWLVPAADDAMRAYPVSSRVSNARNEGPELLEVA